MGTPPTSEDAVLDEKALTSSEDITIDASLDKKLTRKFDKHVVPWLFGLWLLAFIDRSNIGNARIDGLAEDLHLDANKFNIALAVFYVPYICIDVRYLPRAFTTTSKAKISRSLATLF